MAGSSKKTPKPSGERSSGLFVDGWLDKQLDKVVSELSSRDPHAQPRLTGARAASMSDPSWLRGNGS